MQDFTITIEGVENVNDLIAALHSKMVGRKDYRDNSIVIHDTAYDEGFTNPEPDYGIILAKYEVENFDETLEEVFDIIKATLKE